MHTILFLLVALSLPGAISTYKDTQAKFTVEYPAVWEKQELPNINTVAFLKPKGDDEYFQENVNIVKEPLPANVSTLQQLSGAIAAQAKASQGFGKIVTEKDVALAGFKGHEMIYTMSLGPMNLHIWQTWFIKDKTAYIFTYTAIEDKYEQYKPQAKAIVASFKFY